MEPLATYIPSHPRITGFPIQNAKHTLCLFADDIILLLTDVENSLATIHSVLMLFNHISYYKVNNTKSYILGLGITLTLKQKLTLLFPYIFQQERISYLGITLSPTVEGLVKSNCTPFLDK